YLNWNEVIIGTPASVKRSFLKGFSPQVQEWVQLRLYNLNLIRRSRDSSSLLPNLNGPRVRPPGHSGPAGICAYCGVKGHYRSQCAELTANLNAQQVRIWQGEFYFPGLWEKIKGIPQDVVWVSAAVGGSCHATNPTY
ncbi:hypothetical protein VP01_5721g1, partial [Puccinia sorghi]